MIDNIESRIRSIASHFNVNAALADEVPSYIESLALEDREAVRMEFRKRLELGLLGARDFRRATACTARNEDSARRFFEKVYAYAFEDGEEPDVSDYWDR